jgi:lysozyme
VDDVNLHAALRSAATVVSVASTVALAVVTSAGCSSADGDHACAQSTSGALSVCASGATVKGIDVSTYQGVVDWHAAKAAGIEFAFARVSDGVSHPDDQFARNWPAMKTAGVVRGVYQFFRPGGDPVAQADLVMQKLQAAGGLAAGDLPVVMDMEVSDGLSPAAIQANMHTWLTKIEQATGRKPIIYTAAFMSSNVGTGFTAYPLWVANYGATCPTMPANFTAWKFWQDSSTGSVAGVSGAVDTNLWNGTLAQLHTFAGGNAPPPPPPPPKDAGAGDSGAAHDAGGTHDAGSTSHDDAGGTIGSGNPPPAVPDAGAASGSNPCGA